MSGKEIYDNFTGGDGPEGLSGAAAIVNEVAGKYRDRAERIRRLVGRMDAAWQGDAAGAAMRGFGPVEVEHDLAGEALATAQDLTSRQAESFANARNRVVPVPPEPVMPDPWAWVTSPGAVATYWQQWERHDAANQNNVDVMDGYADASTYNGDGMPRSYGALTGDQAGIAVDAGGADTDEQPPESRPKPGEEWRDRGIVERPVRGSETASPGTTGPGKAPPEGGQGPQQTAPGGFAPAPAGPVPSAPVPVDGGGAGSGPPSGGGPGTGWVPGTGFAPVPGGPGEGSGGRGAGGPGGRSAGGPGAGSEARGPGGRSGGEPHGSGGRPGAGGAGGVARGGAGGRGAEGMPVAGAGRGKDAEDLERSAPEYLQEPDPDALFGADVPTPPPVIGDDEPLDLAPSQS